MSWRGRNIYGRLFIILIAIVLVMIDLSAAFLFYNKAERDIKSEIDRKLLHLGTMISLSLSLSDSEFTAEGKEHFDIKNYLTFAKLGESVGVQRIKILNREGVWLDNVPEGIEEPQDKNIYLRAAWNGKTVLSPFYREDNQVYRSGYFPIENGDKVLAVLELREMIPLSKIMDKALANTLIFGVATLLFAIAMILLFNRLSHPKKPLASQELFKEDRYPNPQEEFGFLVQTFGELLEDSRQRGENLQELYSKAERRAEILEGYNQCILRSIRSGVITFDTEGRITTFNDTAEKIFGMKSEEVMNKTYSEVFGKDNKLGEVLKESLAMDKTHTRVEIQLEREDGQPIWVGLSTSLLKASQDRVMGVILLFTDITELKRLQEQVRLKERLATLGEMSAGIAHEIRNPLGAIQGFAKLLQRKFANDDPSWDMAQGIIAEVNGLNTLVTEFLDFARPKEPILEKVMLNEIIDNALSIAEFNKGDNRVHIERNFSSDIPQIIADEDQLRQAFLNLIINSLEAMPEGGELKLSTSNYYPAGVNEDNRLSSGVMVEIEDTGYGIAAENIDKILIPFFTTKSKGTGLGLAIAHKIIVSHGGRIEVRSELGKGTTFRIYLNRNRDILG